MYKIEIWNDYFPHNPREEFEHIGTMVCFHGRYKLGDTHTYNSKDYGSWQELKQEIMRREDPAVILPIYMYDHSGITISTKPFSCPWDSGQIGFIYISKYKAKKEYNTTRISNKLKDKLTEYLNYEVKEYDSYLTGEVYGITLLEGDEVIESVTGFYSRESAECEANRLLKYYNEKYAVEV
jgi:hypothetical protein